MKTLWIAASLGLVSSVALAQSANKTATSLDTCFKLVRVTEANCPASANDAERQECLQNARKMQRVCLELAGQQPAAAVDRPPAAAEAVSADKPVETVSPTLPANPPDKPAEPEKAVAATPTPPVIPTPPVTVTGSISVLSAAQVQAAQASGAKTSGWTVSETSSPVDYSPLVTATILARSGSGNTSTALVVRCRARRSELALRMDSVPRGSRGDEFLAAYQINDQPAVKSRWTASADGKTANYKGDATALLQSLSEDARLKIVVSDGSGRDSEAAFQLAGWSAIRDKIATACMWTSAASKSSERR